MKAAYSDQKLTLKDYGIAVLKFVGVILALGICLSIANRMLPDDWRLKYAFQYSVDSERVTVARKPHDCDWSSTPLGNKHCHYKAMITIRNSENQIVGGTSVKLATSTTGEPIISYDDGETWKINPAGNNLKPVSVSVFWRKVED